MSDIKFDIVSNDISTPLGIEIWIDNRLLLACEHVKETVQFCYQLPDADAKHTLAVILKNKLPSHTTLDSQNNIIKDATITIKNIFFDSVECSALFYSLAKYSHNFNGSSDNITEDFFGTMGCNGTVRLDFETPVYLWLLEHM